MLAPSFFHAVARLGDEALRLVGVHERVEDVRSQRVVGREHVVVRVDRGRLRGQGDAQRLGGGRGGGEDEGG